MLEPVLLCLLILVLGLAVLDLLLPSLAWRLHVWSKRREGITGIERTRSWEWLRITRGFMMLLLAGGVLLIYRSQAEAPPASHSPTTASPTTASPTTASPTAASPTTASPPGSSPAAPLQLPAWVLDGLSADELETLKESLQGARDARR